MPRNTNLRRRDSQFSIVFASSVTICSVLRRRILTQNTASIVDRTIHNGKVRFSHLPSIPIPRRVPIHLTFGYNLRHVFVK